MKIDPSLKYGIIAGVGVVAYFLLFYFLSKAFFFSPWVWWSSLLIFIWAMIKVARPEDDKADLRKGLSRAFTVYVIANAFFFVFYYLLLTHIEPSMIDLQREILASHPMYEGKPEEMDLSLTPEKIFFNYSYSLIGGFFLALVVAGLLNRK
ncbi:MAG: hypothetical protein DHS20C18_08740 [Saprospiraceae bacterium]|nr:MAG: hypothetical protein DHS20C18_08740 [Saprospiraceae bacterium]